MGGATDNSRGQRCHIGFEKSVLHDKNDSCIHDYFRALPAAGCATSKADLLAWVQNVRPNATLSSSPLHYHGERSGVASRDRRRDPGVHQARRQADDGGGADALVGYLAASPAAGDFVPGAGGIRKLRWGLEGRGKRGGARIIYFFHSVDVPLFVLTTFAKNERSDLSQAERNEFRGLTKLLIKTYRRPTP